MADFTIVNLTTAAAGVATTVSFLAQSTAGYTISNSSDLVQTDNYNSTDFDLSQAQPGWLTGRRPSQGQVFPRGVYNR
jgi:hypothetical protein